MNAPTKNAKLQKAAAEFQKEERGGSEKMKKLQQAGLSIKVKPDGNIDFSGLVALQKTSNK